jgi:hypothetical protein
VPEPLSQRLGWVVHEPDVIGLRESRILHRCRGRPSGELGHGISGAVQVTDVNRADDVDPRILQRGDRRGVLAEIIDEHAIAAGQRGYYNGPIGSCTKGGTIAVTILAGPLNYMGVNPKINCAVPQAQQVADGGGSGT